MFQTLRTSTRTHCASLSILICASLIASAQADEFTPEQAQADLERLYSGLKSAEADLFASTPKAVFDRHYEELKAGYQTPVSEAELFSDFQKFAALANHGHTRLEGLSPAWSDYMARDGKLFPLSLSVSHGDVIVAAAPADSGVLPGDRILSIDGKANPVWLKEITQFISAETPALAYALMGRGDFYYFWLAYGERAHYQVTVDRDGTEIAVDLPALTLDVLQENVELEPGFELPGREAKHVADGIGYLRPGPFFDYEAGASGDPYNAEALAAYQVFVDEAFVSFLESDTEHLILDLRDNPGGDSSFSDPVIAWFATEPFRFASEFRIRVSDETTASNQARLDLRDSAAGGVSQKFADLFAGAQNGELVLFDIPETAPRDGERFEGAIHVLVNRYSYSNAVTVAAMIQDYEFGTIYGEETRDMATTYGAMEHFSLPYSNFKVGYPKAHIIRPNGETRSHPVTPDVSIALPPLRGTEDVMLRDVVYKIQHAE